MVLPATTRNPRQAAIPRKRLAFCIYLSIYLHVMPSTNRQSAPLNRMDNSQRLVCLAQNSGDVAPLMFVHISDVKPQMYWLTT